MSTVDLLSNYALIRMDASHLDEVLAIERLSYTNPWALDAFRHELESNVFSRSRVAVTTEAPQRVAGYCVSWVLFEQVHIQNVAVHPRDRRSGLARHLVRRALEDGITAGATTALLEVRRSNVAAQTLYRSLGFSVVGERKGYYRRPHEDAVLLSVPLTRASR